MSTQAHNHKVLIVDDDPVQRRLLEATVQKIGYTAICCDGGNGALQVLEEISNRDISAIVLDLMMPGVDGHAVLRYLSENNIAIPTIVQTAQGGMETAIKAMRAGAFDFVVKPFSPDRLRTALDDALKVARVKTHPAPKQVSANEQPYMVASTDEMNRVGALIGKAAQSDIPVLIEGESGTGKELVARSIQANSRRANKPFVVVNCGAIPDNLVESILFGHEKGAFTGATEKHTGKFVEAHGGTLFLDEIGDLPLNAQVKLLRALQQGEVEPVGSSKPRKVDIRLISATNRDLIAAVRDGRFREDLYYRLNVFPVLVPPLRNRRGDIEALANHFVDLQCKSGQGFIANQISFDAIELLKTYDWPGNIRQLENTIFRAMVLSDKPVLTREDFQQISAQLGERSHGDHFHSPQFDALKLSPDYEKIPTNANAEEFAGWMDEEAIQRASFMDEAGHMRTLAEIERIAISQAISHYSGQMSEVSRRLGIGRSTLYRKLKEYEIEPETLV